MLIFQDFWDNFLDEFFFNQKIGKCVSSWETVTWLRDKRFVTDRYYHLVPMMPPVSSGKWPLMILTLPQNYFLQVSLANRKQAVHKFFHVPFRTTRRKTSFIRLRWVFVFSIFIILPRFLVQKRKLKDVESIWGDEESFGARKAWFIGENKNSPVAWWGHG